MTLSAPLPSVVLLKSLAGEDPIELQGEVVVGRGSVCSLILQKNRLSRQHAKLSVGNQNLLVEDLQSTNGTYINDIKLNKATLAKHGDILRFDTFAYRVFVVGAVEDSACTLNDASVVPKAEIVDARPQVFAAPKSWALDGRKSFQGTQIMSLDMLKQAPSMVDANIAQGINTRGPVLVGLSGDTKGKVFQFNTRNKLSKWEIGREESSDIHLGDVSVSNNHAQLIHEGRRWKLIDLMSANGTYVNDSKGLSSYLSSDDKIRFGQVEFVFRLGQGQHHEGSVSASHHEIKQSNTGNKFWMMTVAAFVITAIMLCFILA